MCLDLLITERLATGVSRFVKSIKVWLDNFKEENKAAYNTYTIQYEEFREDNVNSNYCEINESKAVGLLVDRNRISKMENDDYDKLHNSSLDMMLWQTEEGDIETVFLFSFQGWDREHVKARGQAWWVNSSWILIPRLRSWNMLMHSTYTQISFCTEIVTSHFENFIAENDCPRKKLKSWIFGLDLSDWKWLIDKKKSRCNIVREK